MFPQPVSRGRTLIGRLPKGSDLMAEINRLCHEENIRLGKVQAIGAVSKAMVGFFLQESREYFSLEFDYYLEIISLQGNISIKDGVPFTHAHIALMNNEGKMIGGHLIEGTEVFSCEYIINEYMPEEDKTFHRVLDEETGLFMWPLK
ncbi:MAG: hypothetical protein VR69_16120 [Peptococcaceae bacterium BRH_c4b]|nr:MAG: hypothetical protein VR69_16120 [Peptococcaceae bacterium BRH_c4b]